MKAFYCIIPGKPRSFQTKKKPLRKYQLKVKSIANKSNKKPLKPTKDDDLVWRAIYFYKGNKTDLDVGNWAKGIQDALEGIVYENDSQLKDEHNKLFGFTRDSKTIKGNIPDELISAISEGEEFVYVEVYNSGDGLIKI